MRADSVTIDRVGLFSQSGNAYDEGLSPAFEGIRAFWANPGDMGILNKVKHIFSPEGIREAYTHGVPQSALVSTDPAALDIYFTSRPGAVDIQVALLRNYEVNVKSYPAWQEYLRQHKPKVVAVWGKNDPFFAAPGAEAFKRDIPNADVTILDAGHFLNESNPKDVVEGLKRLL
jgi:pimeloyl-ACP methyl ester carboxylesterase